MYTPKYTTTISVTRRKASPAPRARESELRTWFLWVPSAPPPPFSLLWRASAKVLVVSYPGFS